MAKRDLLLNNFWWKMTALLLAIIVWLTFHSGDKLDFKLADSIGSFLSTREMVGHPITVMMTASDSRDFKVTPQQVDIVLSGSPGDLKKLGETNVQAFVDLTSWSTNESLALVRVYAPRGIKLERVTPEQAHVELVKP